MPGFPSDCVLIPTQKGALLVSPSHGLYCAVLPGETQWVKEHLCQQKSDIAQDFPEDLHKRLKEHGFFDGPRPFEKEPPLLQFQVTNACNLRCIYCAVNSGIARPRELSLEDVKRTIDEAVSVYSDIRISFTGGEPLIVPWLFEAIDYAKQRSKHQVGLLSNLLLIKDNEDLFNKIVAFVQAGHQLRMSMSGVDREVCNRLSGKDCFDDAIEVIRRLKKANALPWLDVPLSASDAQANIQAYPWFRRTVPIDHKLYFAKMCGGGRESGEHVFTSSDDEERMLDDLVFECGTSIEQCKPSPTTCRRHGCPCDENEYMCVRSDGEVFSCFRLLGRIGNISEGIKTIAERRHKTPGATQQEPCCSCPFVMLCACGCKADKLVFEATSKDPVCGPWRRKLVAEMLFEDKSYIFDWPFLYLLAEARKRGFMH